MENIEANLKTARSYTKVELEDKELYQRELALLSSQWIFIDHISSFKKVGDYKVYELLEESVIVVKTEYGFSGHLNFCSHRGSTLCEKKQGHAKAFTCPYHNWSFEIDGKLKSAPSCSMTSLQKSENSLKKVDIKDVEGILFAGLNVGSMVDFETVKRELNPLFSWQGLSKAKVAHTYTFTLSANWKLAVDNFMECYHCYANHPEMCKQLIHPKVTSTESPTQYKQFEKVYVDWCQKTAVLGHPIGGDQNVDVNADQFIVTLRSVLNTNTASYGKDGESLAPLMGKYKVNDNGETFGFCGPMTHFSMPTDFAFIFRINVRSISETTIELHWLVDEDAKEDVDYNVTDLSWFWKTTMKQDIIAIERAAAGARSRFFQPAVYNALEHNSALFSIWYRERIAAISQNATSRVPAPNGALLLRSSS